MVRQLSIEFKRECAELVINYGYAHKDVAKMMGGKFIFNSTLTTQFKQERQGITPKNGTFNLEVQQYKIRSNKGD